MVQFTCTQDRFNSLPLDKIMDSTKFEDFADDTLNVVEMVISVFDRTENILGKGENAGNQLLFPKCFQMPSLSGLF